MIDIRTYTQMKIDNTPLQVSISSSFGGPKLLKQDQENIFKHESKFIKEEDLV